jgi:putative transposase
LPIKDLALWCKKNNISDQTRNVIDYIRRSEPARRVKSGKGNVSGFYSSKKMGVTIQFESRTLELAGIYEMEHDPNVLEYYDQPPSIKINYVVNGKNRGHLYTPDFFIISKDWIGWEEWKTETDLKNLSEKSNRYYQGSDGKWYCPPGEEYAKQYGLSFRVRTDKDIDWIYQRNIRFLEDYMLEEEPFVPVKAWENIRSIVEEKPGITLEEMLSHPEEYSADDIYRMIIKDDLYVDIRKDVIPEYDTVKIYSNSETAKAYSYMVSSTVPLDFSVSLIELQAGKRLQWNGSAWIILNIGETHISLLSDSDDAIELPNNVFEQLVKDNKIKGLQIKAYSSNNEVLERLKMASMEDLQEANMKYQIIEPILKGRVKTVLDTPERTIRDWLAKYRHAEQRYGNGYIGLIPNRHNRGNRLSKLPDETINLMNEYITNKYETLVQQSMFSVYCVFKKDCKEKGIFCASYKTFTKYIEKRSKHELEEKRKGPKAAYDTEILYWGLEMTTPRHGDRIFEICHMDHTQLEIEIVCSKTKKNLGRPWVTFLTDAYSRRILSFYLTFDEPSYRSCMMALRECVRRHSRLPVNLVVDGGKEFHSTYFETLLAFYKCNKLNRPGAKPRFGSVCERLFGTTDAMFIHNLIGNTQLTKNVRQVTKKINPKNNAIWTFSNFAERLMEWCYELYDQIGHPALGESPRDAFLSSIAKSGKRESTYVSFDETFKMLSLPTTAKGTAKVFAGKGVKINYIYYWSDALSNPEVEGEQVAVRYDPYSMGIAYAYVKNRWVMLNSEYFRVFVNRTEKEIQIATEEIRKKRKLHTKQSFTLTSKMLADFLTSIESDEALQLQRMRDSETKQMFQVIEGGKAKSQKDDETIEKISKPKSVRKSDIIKLVEPQKKTSVVSNNNFVMYEDF